MTDCQQAKNFIRESFWKRGEQAVQNLKLPPEQPFNASAEIIPLPEPEMFDDHNVNFLEMIELRSTIRQYSSEALSQKELSYLLWCTQGVKAANGNMTLRTVPSAGAGHSLETYLLVRRVEGLSSGVYRFLPIEHAVIKADAAMEALTACFSTFRTAESSAVSFIWSTVIQRLACRFGSRAYRYAFLDAGHVCQNLCLAAQTIAAGVCPLGAFDDEKINAALGFDENEQFVIYGAAVGKI